MLPGHAVGLEPPVFAGDREVAPVQIREIAARDHRREAIGRRRRGGGDDVDLLEETVGPAYHREARRPLWVRRCGEVLIVDAVQKVETETDARTVRALKRVARDPFGGIRSSIALAAAG